MKKKIIEISTSVLIISDLGLVPVVISPQVVVSEKFFLEMINESTSVCLN